MQLSGVILSTGFLFLNYLVYSYLRLSKSDFYQVDECPFCYGMDLCDDFINSKITFETNSFVEFFYNYFSVKNVYFGEYNNIRVVLKKFGHYSYFKICSNATKTIFVNLLLDEAFSYVPRVIGDKMVWSILETNVEPLILQVFNRKDGWPVPGYYGACGHVTVEENVGTPLCDHYNLNWTDRALLALQLLEAARNFTDDHPYFNLYLTDVSCDNIAVDSNLKLRFVDLDGVILNRKDYNDQNHVAIHNSRHFEDETNFMFSEEEICANTLSDHNYYAVCAILLSPKASQPLLHTVPDDILVKFPKLLTYIDECVNPSENFSRFEAVANIVGILKNILYGDEK